MSVPGELLRRREQRQADVQAGLCPTCRERFARDGRVSCEGCGAKERARRTGPPTICPRCKGPAFGGRWCRKCALRRFQVRNQWVAAGGYRGCVGGNTTGGCYQPRTGVFVDASFLRAPSADDLEEACSLLGVDDDVPTDNPGVEPSFWGGDVAGAWARVQLAAELAGRWAPLAGVRRCTPCEQANW